MHTVPALVTFKLQCVNEHCSDMNKALFSPEVKFTDSKSEKQRFTRYILLCVTVIEGALLKIYNILHFVISFTYKSLCNISLPQQAAGLNI